MAFRASSAEDRFGFFDSGTIKVRYRFDIPIILAMLAVLLAGIVCMIIEMNAVEMKESGEVSYRLIAFGFNMGMFTVVAALVVAWALICAAVTIVLLTGTHRRFSADEESFTLILSGGAREQFFYDDIEEVRFSSLRILFIERGFRVTIRTRFRNYTCDTIYTQNKVHRTPEGTAFFIIVQRAGLVKHRLDDYNVAYRRIGQEG
ncbi:MAG: hypothetical protein ACI4KM_11025 [Oscillospiraceae bacterium]